MPHIVLTLSGVMVGVLLAELTLRVLGISYPQLYAPDEVVGSRLRPGTAGTWLAEGRSRVRINSSGQRDDEHSQAKPSNVYRVAVLGDSFAEALQVSAEDAFWAVAERELAERDLAGQGGRRVEFINFGVSGYGTAQELLTLRHFVWQFDPDLVLLAVCHNDLQDNSSSVGGREAKPYFELQNGELVPDTSFLQSAAYLTAQTKYEQQKARVINASYLLQVLKQAKANLPRALEAGDRLSRSEPERLVGGLRDMATANNIYAAPESAAEIEAWEITERLVIQIATEVAQQGAQFAAMTITTPLQVHPDPAVRARATAAGGVADLFYLERRLLRLGQKHDFPVLALGEPLQAVAEREQLFLHGFHNSGMGTGHWNETGHRLAGTRLAIWLSGLTDRSTRLASQR